MPSVIYETLIDNATALPPGGRIDSKVIDVRGADRVSVNVSITNVDANVRRTIYFGPTTNNAVAPLRTDPVHRKKARRSLRKVVRGPWCVKTVRADRAGPSKLTTGPGTGFAPRNPGGRELAAMRWLEDCGKSADRRLPPHLGGFQ